MSKGLIAQVSLVAIAHVSTVVLRYITAYVQIQHFFLKIIDIATK